ncbi:MAG: carbamoyltransferase HypF [Acidobacteria bacterium]|nr:carbamoyltransferase HypF [Acidobacteriota bacterium]MBI3663978.1 carbamoyltransferase HypF [Acidobacteriota bacterium]
MQVRKAIEVTGIVQGVGFRPYVYRLATERGLVGTIANTAAGVTLEIQGPAEAVEDFLARLPAEAPPLARITGVMVRDLAANGDSSFVILPSRAGAEHRALISPDVAVCADCLRELFDPADRRHLYPFINCTNCGPRFTIVRDIPYDRPRTSMSVFPMCPVCQAEYDDPANRRFHAQPNACWECGPRVELWDAGGAPLAVRDAIAEASARLQEGAVVAVKGLGGFHLACDATNPRAVERLREAKRRVEKPFAVMAPDIASIEAFCAVDEPSRELLLSVQRPIVLLPKRKPNEIAEAVAPFNRYLGVFLPYTPIHFLLFAAGNFRALVMTSGNLREEPIAIDNREAAERLRGMADFFLVHNREILLRCDDSVLRVAAGRARQVRRSRGFVPVPVFLKEELPPILAVGGELKDTICMTKGREAFLSQHIGDLENLETYRFFEETVERAKRILEIRPAIIAHDLHPAYFSTQWALKQSGLKTVGVQHHHAHIAACMAENRLDGRVIGIALDGTGYGADGAIWGGEVLLADYRDFERTAHFEYVTLPGGEAAIREPWRMAFSYLVHHFGRDLFGLHIPFVEQLQRDRAEVVLRMIERGVNAPLTSSCGRLFDAVAALAGIRHAVNYEAQAAIELEMAIGDAREDAAYPFAVEDGTGVLRIGTRPMFAALIEDLRAGTPSSLISLRFHNGLVEVFARLARRLRARTDHDRVCLSGGTFQNVHLLEHLEARLAADGFRVFTHSEVPVGDGGLSLGQALVAAHRVGF